MSITIQILLIESNLTNHLSAQVYSGSPITKVRVIVVKNKDSAN